MGDFRGLKVWEMSKDLAVEIYKITNISPFDRDFRFTAQIRSAAVSIPSNIAEGDELMTNRQAVKHFYIAKGSVAELITQLIIAKEIGFIDKQLSDKLIDRLEHISSILNKLIKRRQG